MAEEIAIQIKIDASKGAKTIQQMVDTTEDLNKELQKLKKGEKGFDSITKEVKRSNKAMSDLFITVDKGSLTIKELEKASESLNEELKTVDRSSDRFKTLQASIVDVNRELGNTELGLRGLNREDIASTFGQFTGATGTLTSAFILLGGEGNQTIEEIGKSLQRAIGITQAFQGSIEAVTSSTKLFKNFSGIIKSNSTVIKLATVAQTGYNKVQQFFGKSVDASAKSLKGFKTAIIATGIGAIVILVGALIANFDKLSSAISGVSKEQQSANEVNKKAIESASEELSAIDRLKTTINDETISREDRNKAVAELQEEYPDLLSNIDSETASTEMLNAEITKYTALVTLRAQAEATAEIRAENFKKIIEAQTEAQTGQNVGFFDRISAIISESSAVDILTGSYANEENSIKIAQKAQDNANASTNEAIEVLNKQITSLDNLDKGFQTEISNLEKSLGLDKESLDSKAKEEEQKKKNAENAKKRREEAERARIKSIEDEKKRIEELAKFEEQILQSTLDNQEDLLSRRLLLEFEANVERAKSLIRDEDKLTEILATINEEYFEDLNDIKDKFSKLDEDKQQALINLNRKTADALNLLDKQQALVNADNIDNEVDREKAKSKAIINLNSAKIQKLRTLEDIALQDTELTEDQRLEIIKGTELEISKIKQEQRDINKEADIKAIDDRKALNDELISAGFEVVQMISDTAFAIAEQARAKEFEQRSSELEAQYSREASQLQKQVDLGIKTQRVADRELAKLDKDKASQERKLKKEAFDQDKKTKTSQALINGALALTQIFASTPPPASFILAGVQIITTALSIAQIQKQKFGRGGIIRGASHSNGGVDLGNGNEAEGGEVIINKRSSRIFRNELSAINQAGGGISFARGGIIPQESASQASNGELTNSITTLNEKLSRPFKAFVVGKEVEDHLQNEAQLERNADL